MKNFADENVVKTGTRAKLLAFCFGILTVIALAITGLVAGFSGVVNTNGTSNGFDIYGEPTDYSVYANAPLTFATPTNNSLIIAGGVGDSFVVVGDDNSETTGVKTFFENSTLTTYIKDTRSTNSPTTPYKYLTSKIKEVVINYQIGAGTYNSKVCIFVVKITIPFEMINAGIIDYTRGTISVKHQALEVIGNTAILSLKLMILLLLLLLMFLYLIMFGLNFLLTLLIRHMLMIRLSL